jgi:hypothetical protein
VPIRNIYGPAASHILAFAEGQELAEDVEELGFWSVFGVRC